jgi:hypothetical protein
MSFISDNKGKVAASAAVTLLIAFFVVAYVVGDMFASHLRTAAHDSFYVLGPVLGIIALIALAVGAFAVSSAHQPKRDRYNSYSRPASDTSGAATSATEALAKTRANIRTATRILGVVTVVVTLAAVGFTVKFWVTHNYLVDREYIAAVKVVETPAPGFAQRPAQPIAAASAKTNLGDNVGDLQATRFVTDGTSDTWNALVARKATFGGYESVQAQNLPLTGASIDPTFCKFTTASADRRLGGHFTHSLDRSIYHLARGVTFDSADAYGLCTGPKLDHPLVVVPLTKVQGWLYAHQVPAGVAVYDGLTGKTTVVKNVKQGQLAGPVYPISLAARTRAAAAAVGSFSDYWHNRVGFEETAGDDGDPNGDNRAEFALRGASVSTDAAYVTPLTPRGASVSIVAEGVVTSDSSTYGQLNTFTVHKLGHSRVANSATAVAIKSNYGDLPEWAAGMKIYEITPVSATEWVASLGMNQNINYRVLVKSNGDSCLERVDGTKLRCGKVTGIGGNGPGVALAPANGSASAVPVPANNAGLVKLTNAQLVALQEQVTRELVSRIDASSTTR